ncbi:hypothetical protein CO038_00890 [Candidatus Pacearchaeota archaeon CG_4_9_14_0_2_um_filter_39_13]|nr:hypothetical protein [Candidatus Pacearchaeota archaeon]OIO42943.1 MAG: hypothetical protein AUJ64_03155 [Candidatus Pacearchaeota archaeon CG1_02_39_14]PJC44991.1 MAG: hypothetical protein CO038_00890 [Candidatus Pacearchaeota archaeon CG_4_9_14_0_2_um_filter_39_13]
MNLETGVDFQIIDEEADVEKGALDGKKELYNSRIGRIVRAGRRRREQERVAAALESYNRHFNPNSPQYIGR